MTVHPSANSAPDLRSCSRRLEIERGQGRKTDGKRKTKQEGKMQITQLFETTVADRDQNYVVRFITLPTRAIEAQGLLTNQADLLDALGLQDFRALPSLSLLPYAIALMLQGGAATAISDRLQGRDFDALPTELVTFAEYASFARLVPFEASLAELQSVAGIIASGSPLAIGTLIGITAAAGATGPVFIGAVAAGIILVWVADAVGRDLHYHILKVMGVPSNTPENPGIKPPDNEQNEEVEKWKKEAEKWKKALIGHEEVARKQEELKKGARRYKPKER